TSWGNPETTPGGLALKYHASIGIDIRRIASIKDGTEITGNRTRVKVVKNKVAPPFRMVEFDIIYGQGISSVGELVDLGTEYKIFTRKGTWYSYGEEKIGQGRDKVINFLNENPDIKADIEAKVRQAMGLPPIVIPEKSA
ncbi:MAG: hypothetical protein P9M15_04655, partial [Candidatus Electryoneaceae bacterium]|nr:hypothetical protein [Candidatus Electryoneaceae bacterium]